MKKSIGVFSNDPENRNMHLTFEASIKPIFQITPSKTVILTGKTGERKRAEVLITAGLDKPLNLEPERFTLGEGKVSYSIETVVPERQYRVVFTNNPNIHGSLNGELRLKTNYTEKPRINIGIRSRFN